MFDDRREITKGIKNVIFDMTIPIRGRRGPFGIGIRRGSDRV
jgi:hypothetical protein